jgi:hypothetical protein
MIATIVAALIAVSALWVYWDATANKIGKVPGAGGMFNLSAGAWSVVTLFLWIVAFPAYVVKRSALIERARSQPVEVRGRWVKFSVLLIIGVLMVLFQGEPQQQRVAAPARPVPVAPKVAAVPPPVPVAAAASTEVAKPTRTAFQPGDDKDRVLKATLVRISELEREVAELQRQVAMKNNEIAAAMAKAPSR